MENLPKEFYYIVGSLLVTQAGTVFAFFKSKTDNAYKQGYRDAEIKKDFERVEHKADKAHERIDRLKKDFNDDRI